MPHSKTSVRGRGPSPLEQARQRATERASGVNAEAAIARERGRRVKESVRVGRAPSAKEMSAFLAAGEHKRPVELPVDLEEAFIRKLKAAGILRPRDPQADDFGKALLQSVLGVGDDRDIANLFRVIALNDADFAKQIANNLEHQWGKSLFFKDRASPQWRLRRIFSAAFFGGTESVRREFVTAILCQFAARSARLANAMAAQPQQAVWDVAVIGALGPHGAKALDVLTQTAAPKGQQPQRVLGIDYLPQLGELGGTFGPQGESFYLNSPQRQNRGGDDVAHSGDINPIAGSVSVADTTPRAWPRAITIAETAAEAVYETQADLRTDAPVTKVEERGTKEQWPARYRLTLADGTAAYANRVLVTTGLGVPTVPFRDDATRALTLEELERSESWVNGAPVKPGVMTVSQALRYAQRALDPLDAFRDGESGRQIITLGVGLGDSTRTFWELMVQLGPESAYKFANAQKGQVTNGIWAVGEDGPADALEYLIGKAPASALRQGSPGGVNAVEGEATRYSQLSGAVERGLIDLLPDYIERIERETRSDGRPSGRFVVTQKSGETLIVDRIVLGTGYESQAGELFSSLVPNDTDLKKLAVGPLAQKVADERSKDRRTLGTRLNVGNVAHDIYFAGAAAPGLLTPEDKARRGIRQNIISLQALNELTGALVRQQLTGGSSVESALEVAMPAVEALAGGVGEASIDVPPQRAREQRVSDVCVAGDDEVSLKLKLAVLLSRYSFAAGSDVALRVVRQGGQLKIRSASVGAPGLRTIADAIARDLELVQLLCDRTLGGERAVEVSARLEAHHEQWVVAPASIEVSSERVRLRRHERASLDVQASYGR